MNRYLYIAGLLALLVVSCVNDPIMEYSGNELRITGNVNSSSRTTFVQGDGVIETHWKVDDEIGLWSENQKNLKYKALNEGKSTDFQCADNEALTKKDGEKVYAYYPFTNEIYKDSIKLPNTCVFNRDSFSPFLYSQGQIDGDELNLQFKHLYAYLKINISVQNIKDVFLEYKEVDDNDINSIEKSAMWIQRRNKPDTLATENAFINPRTSVCSGTFSDRIGINFGKDMDFNSDSTYTYLVPIWPISGGQGLDIGFYFGSGTRWGMHEKDIPNEGLKAGHVYNWDLTDSKKADSELYEALESFYHKTGGDSWWHKDNWLSEKSINEWYGINQGAFKYSTLRNLNFSNQNLIGPFPEEIATFMETADYIDLSLNYLTGTIPEKVRNHRNWRRLGWRMIQQFQTTEGQLDLTNSNLYASDVHLDYLFEVDNQKPLTLHEYMKQNKLTQVLCLRVDYGDSFDDILSYINENRINQHLDYQAKGLKTIVYCSSHNYDRDWLKEKISQYFGELEGFDWVYGYVPINSFYFHNSYVFDSNAQLVYNANYNIGCPSYNSPLVHNRLSKFFYNQLGEPSEHSEFTFNLTSKDFSKDGDVFVIQEATEGIGINMVFLGEGYVDKEMGKDGLYEKEMKEAAEIFFSIEPYKTFRNRFNIYGVKVVSPNVGFIEGEHGINGDNSVCFKYANKIPNADGNTPMVSVVYRNFSWAEHMGRSHTYMYNDGSFVAYLYKGVKDISTLIHEVGGHGFGQLKDEYVEPGNESLTLPKDRRDNMDNQWNNYGIGANVDWRNDKATVKWSHFLNDSRYANEGIGLYEGAYLYGHGAYRPTENSMMRYNDSPFNAPSREQIYKRIMQLSEGENWKYDYEEFVKFDAKNRNAASRSAFKPLTETERQEYIKNHRPPTIIKGTWHDAMKGKGKVVVPLR